MDDDTEVKLTQAESKAIARLQKLANKWPKSLLLFSQSGSLLVLKPPKEDATSTLLRYTAAEIVALVLPRTIMIVSPIMPTEMSASTPNAVKSLMALRVSGERVSIV